MSTYVKEVRMSHLRRYTIVAPIVFLWLALVSTPGQTQDSLRNRRLTNLYPKGPSPQTLKIKAGTPVVWQSHLSNSKGMVVLVAFFKGEEMAQATKAVEGMNGFELEGGHYVGRMEGSGGTVALRFSMPGDYTYNLGHQKHMTGQIVVHH